VTAEAPWVKASQGGWEQRALELEQPLWLKVACMAYARVGANGHANFERGELANLMGKCRQDIDRAIRTAVGKGWLDEGSCTECLIPPGDFIEMSFGTSRKTCKVHERGRQIIRGAARTRWQPHRDEAFRASDVSTECLQPHAFSASDEVACPPMQLVAREILGERDADWHGVSGIGRGWGPPQARQPYTEESR
jgi:hypothetical protein